MCCHTHSGVKLGLLCPRITSAEATSGVAALVPTTWIHCPPHTSRMPSVPSAAADTSASMRVLHVGSVCQDGFAIAELQPLPVAPL